MKKKTHFSALKISKKLLGIALLFSTLSVFGQDVNIPDAIFKAALVADLNINTNSDTEIQMSEAAVLF